MTIGEAESDRGIPRISEVSRSGCVVVGCGRRAAPYAPRRRCPLSELNSLHNRCVWFDIPVADIDRAIAFYAAVLGVPVEKCEFGGTAIGVIDHDHGNGGCLVRRPEDISGSKGLVVYLNANGRIRAAVAAVSAGGGSVIEPVHAIGPHGFRAVVLDSEGNRVALHSSTDA